MKFFVSCFFKYAALKNVGEFCEYFISSATLEVNSSTCSTVQQFSVSSVNDNMLAFACDDLIMTIDFKRRSRRITERALCFIHTVTPWERSIRYSTVLCTGRVHFILRILRTILMILIHHRSSGETVQSSSQLNFLWIKNGLVRIYCEFKECKEVLKLSRAFLYSRAQPHPRPRPHASVRQRVYFRRVKTAVSKSLECNLMTRTGGMPELSLMMRP